MTEITGKFCKVASAEISSRGSTNAQKSKDHKRFRLRMF